VLIDSFGGDLGLEVDRRNEANAVTGWAPDDPTSSLKAVVNEICSAPQTYHLVSFYFKDKKAHATATYYGGAWFYPDTVIFDPDQGEIAEINKAYVETWLETVHEDHPIDTLLVFRLKMKDSKS